MNEFLRDTLKMVIGHCSLNVGWNGIQASSLDLLTDVLEKYIVEIGQSAHRYSEQFGRSEPNLDDLGLAFKELGIFIHDLSEFTTNVEPIPFPYDVCKLPVPKESFLNFLKPGSSEVLTRPVHIYEYLPPMLSNEQDVVDASDDARSTTELSDLPLADTSSQDTLTQTPTVKSSLFKRPESTDKLRGLALADEGQPFREIASVMMTTSGYLSSSREGKVAESRIPKNFFDEVEVPQERKSTSKKSLGIAKRLEESAVTFEKPAPQPIEKHPEPVEKRPPVVSFEKEPVIEPPIASDVPKDKEKALEKEKVKKKRPKQVMEEFAFFEKDKGKSPVPKPPPAEAKPASDPAKKLSIFKKLPKNKPVESPIVPVESKLDFTTRPEPPAKLAPVHDFNQKPSQDLSDTHRPSEPSDSDKASKREKKLNKKKEKMKIRDSMLEEKFQGEPSKVDSDFSSFGYHSGLNQAPVESPLTEIQRVTPEPSKKKRARISDSLNTERPFESVEPPSTANDAASSSKMFFPYPPSFPVPNAIPPPQLFPNVPFNLLGMTPLGVRPLLGNVPPPNVTSSPVVRSHPTPANPPERPSPSKSPPNIVDSLPDSAETFSPVEEATEDAVGISAKKKDKRDKKDKEKKKKDKKNKDRDKDDEKKLKRDKKKEKKDKEKLKMKERDDVPSASVPKITFKFGGPSSSPCPPAESTPKLIFKPMAERERTPTTPSKELASPTSPASSVSSVEVAKFSALVTRPPKVVKPSVKKEPVDKLPEIPSSSARPSAPPVESRSPSPKFTRPDKPSKPPKVTKDREKDKNKKTDKVGDVAIITETVGSYYDEFGNKIWICPACGRQDDGTPMIGCDECDDWYHWVCVGIRVPPAETESWFCQRCIAKKQGCLKDKKKGRKKKSV